MGGAAPDTGGHLLVEAHYAQTVPTQFGVQMKESRKQLLESALLLHWPLIEHDFQIRFRRFQRFFNEICQRCSEAAPDADKWGGCVRLCWCSSDSITNNVVIFKQVSFNKC